MMEKIVAVGQVQRRRREYPRQADDAALGIADADARDEGQAADLFAHGAGIVGRTDVFAQLGVVVDVGGFDVGLDAVEHQPGRGNGLGGALGQHRGKRGEVVAPVVETGTIQQAAGNDDSGRQQRQQQGAQGNGGLADARRGGKRAGGGRGGCHGRGRQGR